mgnify:CR=1 FL=1
MTDIRLDLDTTDFASLLEAARAAIPANAAGWTDHNIHDPGIMLIELLAHLADVQIHSLSRLRKDERLAFAALLNTGLSGPKPARVLLWPRPPAPGTAGALGAFAGRPVPAGLAVAADLPGSPPFRTIEALSVSGIRIDRVLAETSDGRSTDWGDPGRTDRAGFFPFATNPTPLDALILRCGMAAPVAEPGSDEAPLALGCEIVPAEQPPDSIQPRRFLALSLRQGGDEVPLRLLADGTDGLFRTGVLRFARPRNIDTGRAFELVLRPAGSGLMRRPCLRRIAFDVVSAEQSEDVTETVADFGTGLPDQAWKPGRSGRIETEPLTLDTLDVAGVRRAWASGRPDEAGPGDTVFFQDERDGAVRFGNGVNGRAPGIGETLEARYVVTDGIRGNVASVASWTAQGLSGPVWFNPAPAVGGTDAETLVQLQARVRQDLIAPPLCVTTADLVSAVRNLNGFGADALVLPGSKRGLHRPASATQLMAWLVEPALGRDEPSGWQPPSRAWLREVRDRLRARLPLGQSLDVVAPTAVRIGVQAELELDPRADAAAVLSRCGKLLRRRLAARGSDARDPSLAAPATIALTAVRGWLRTEPGVRAVRRAALIRNGLAASETIALRPNERCVPEIVEGNLRIATTAGEDAR